MGHRTEIVDLINNINNNIVVDLISSPSRNDRPKSADSKRTLGSMLYGARSNVDYGCKIRKLNTVLRELAENPGRYGAVGGLVQNKPLICGGAHRPDGVDKLYG